MLIAGCDTRGGVGGVAPGSAGGADSGRHAVAASSSDVDERRDATARGAEPTRAEADSTRLGALRASTLPAGFDLVTAPKPFEFPRDHGPHPSFRHEWWYVTGHLDTPTGEPFGFELTFFRFALKPLIAAPGEPQSAWRSRQIYMAHFAISDINRKQFLVSEHFARDALGLAGAQADPFRVSLDDWSLAATPDSKAWRLLAADRNYALDIEMDPSAPIMLNGDAGFSRKADAEGAASYYYSIPRMTAHGKLTRDGKPLDVKGTVWLDREWGSGALGSDQQGWDWFALQLNDGSALMFYALRKRSGERDAHSAGTWLAPDGKSLALSNDDVQIDSTAEWTSPQGTRYPARWHVRVPKLALDVDIQPRLANQELNTSTRYWEGASLVKGTRENKTIEGKAYVELVGY
jgi:predicted secreted hydrolase